MPLFSVKSNYAVEQIHIKPLDKEKTIQKIFEKNLLEILNITFIKSEHQTTDGRIDTLGIDENGTPCIIEYKKSKSHSIINQSISYLKWLTDHKESFEKLVEEEKILKKKVDWASPRVICIAESYTKFDIDTAEYLNIKIELYKFQLHKDDILLVEREGQQMFNRDNSRQKEQGTTEQKQQHTVEEHLEKPDGNILKEYILELHNKIPTLDNNITVKANQQYIAYKLTRNFVDIRTQKDKIKIYLNMKKGTLTDEFGITKDASGKGHQGNGDYEIIVKEKQLKENGEEYKDKIFSYIEQSYDYSR